MALQITTSQGKRNPRGSVVEVAGVRELADTLAHLPAVVEGWWSQHTWRNSHRNAAAWLGACAVGADLDYHDDDGKHCPPPQDLAERLAAAARAGAIPGSLFHLTPRGARVIFVFPEQITDAAAFDQAAREAGLQVAEAVAAFPGYTVDEPVLFDRARLLYTPTAIVDGIPRSAEVIVMREQPFVPAPARRFRVVEADPQISPVDQYNRDHARDWGKSGSGSCLACGHNGCFGRDAKSPDRWYCFSTNHPDGIGVRGDRGHHGDALDLDAAVASLTPAQLLERDGYTGKRRAGSVTDLPKRFRTTDTGNAERLCAAHGQGLRYCHPWREWLAWDGRRWKTDNTAEVELRAKQTVRAMYVEAAELDDEDARKNLANWAHKSEDKKHRSAMVSLAASEPGIPVLPQDLDANAWALNVLNGTLNLRSGQLEDHRRDALCTKLTPVWFDAGALCPLWDKFLLEVMGGDAELVAFLQRSIGYALTADVSAQVLFFFHGSGANGKSTLTTILLALLGDYGRQAAPDLLLAKRGETHPTEQADLFGARAVVCQEIQQGRALAEATVKQLTGGDPITARRMRQDFFTFDPTHKLFIAANHKPRVRDTTHSIWRRVLLVPFLRIFRAEERDSELLTKLRGELAGILSWALRGCMAWQAAGGGYVGLAPPEKVLLATQQYKEEEDHVGSWVSECFERAPTACVTAKNLWESYSTWCDENGDRPLNRKSLASRLVELGMERTHKRDGWHWIGLRLHQKSERDP